MKGLNPRGEIVETGSNNNKEIDWELKLGGMLVHDDAHQHHNHGGSDSGPTIKINVSHGSNQLHLTVPSPSTFGDLKRVIAQETGMEPKEQRLLFRGKEKEDQEYLHMAGLKDNSKVLLMDDSASKETKLEEVKGSSELSRGGGAVAEVRAEDDKFSDQVAALETVVNGGTEVAEKDIVFLTEMLVRQLLKLDGIDAEGERKVQRKMEVRRVQSLVDTMDNLKALNSNLISNKSIASSVTAQSETFESDVGSLNTPPSMPPYTKVTEDWESFD